MGDSLLAKTHVLRIYQLVCVSTIVGFGVSNGSLSPDAQALLEFKKDVFDPMGDLSSWQENRSAQICDNWWGVGCDQSSHVIKLNLSQAHLPGYVPESALSMLHHLQVLSLGGNNFSGNLTGSFLNAHSRNCTLHYVDLSSNVLNGFVDGNILGSCSSLKVLNLSHNQITELPLTNTSSSISVEILDLSWNNLSAEGIPDLFRDCGSLQTLKLSNNYLKGGLILQGNCSKLRTLDLSFNSFSGEVLSGVDQFNSLENINLSGNQITGPISPSLGALKSLTHLNMSNNNLTQGIPSDLANTCGTLQVLDLSNNNLSGSIPVKFSACASLISLHLSSNNLTGEFPDILGEMQSLHVLKADYNGFEGQVPASTYNCTSLEVLDLSCNKLSIVPDQFCGINSALKSLYLSNNLFRGPVPTSIANCTHLKILDLSLNLFLGKIPPDIGRLIELEQLLMWYNNLSGEIPPEIGRCGNLKALLLSNNNLRGTIPPQLSNCSKLGWISLDHNQLTGTISSELCALKNLTIFQASYNSFTGNIPLELANCSSLFWLDLNSNQLDGVIPPNIGRVTSATIEDQFVGVGEVAFARNLGSDPCNGAGELLETHGITSDQLMKRPFFKLCKFRFYEAINSSVNLSIGSLMLLDLSYNKLVGNIPEELGSMNDVMVLDLRNNLLNGSIPSSFGHLKNLEMLNLACNQLQGNIPSSLINLTFLTELNLSNNHLYGSIPQGGQLTTFIASAYSNNDGLCDYPLNACTSTPPTVHHFPPPPGVALHRRMVPMTPVYIILLLTCPVVLLLIILLSCIFIRKNFNQCSNATAESVFPMDPDWGLPEKESLSINVAIFERPLRKIDFTDLVEATKGFDMKNVLGSGGYGEVYKADLRDGSTVAVKKLTRFNYQGQRQFIAEMETLGKIKHPNLVPLIGYCKIGEERILIYDYMPRGSLEQLLHETPRISLPWESRKKIVCDIARGLAFLHHHCIPHVIHRDLKSSNVLLDDCFVARLSDFGMARLISASDTHNSVTSLAGTPGYVPPEYYQSCKCTKEGDVYSFGVVLLEILTRRKPTGKEEFEDSNLVGWVKLHLQQHKSIQVFDPDLVELNMEQELLQYLNLACNCLEDQPSYRPSMLQVVAALKELLLQQQSM